MGSRQQVELPQSDPAATGSAETLSFLRRGAAAIVLAGCLIVPLVFTISLEDTFALPKLVTLGVIVPVALVLTVAGLHRPWWGRRSERSLDPVSIAVGAFVALNALAFLFSVDPSQSLIGEPLQYQGLIAVLLYAGSFAVARLTLAEDRRVALLFAAIGAGAVLVSIYALLQLAGLDPLWGRPEDGRVFSTIGQPNALAAYLVIAIPLTAGLLPRLERRTRLLAVAGMIGMVVALASTMSRAGYLALVVAGAIVLPPLVRALELPLRRSAAGAVGVVLILVVLATIVAPVRGLSSGVLERARSAVNIEDDVSIRAHLALWSVGWRIALDHPLLGTGHETFPELYPLYRRHVLGASRASVLAGFRPESPHNVYLAVAGGAGFPALLAYVAMIGAFLVLVHRKLRDTAGARQRLLLVGALAAVAGHLVTDVFMTAEITGSWLFWTLVGATVGTATRRHPRMGG